MPNKDHSLDVDRVVVRDQGYVRNVTMENMKTISNLSVGDYSFPIPGSGEPGTTPEVGHVLVVGPEGKLRFVSPASLAPCNYELYGTANNPLKIVALSANGHRFVAIRGKIITVFQYSSLTQQWNPASQANFSSAPVKIYSGKGQVSISADGRYYSFYYAFLPNVPNATTRVTIRLVDTSNGDIRDILVTQPIPVDILDSPSLVRSLSASVQRVGNVLYYAYNRSIINSVNPEVLIDTETTFIVQDISGGTFGLLRAFTLIEQGVVFQTKFLKLSTDGQRLLMFGNEGLKQDVFTVWKFIDDPNPLLAGCFPTDFRTPPASVPAGESTLFDVDMSGDGNTIALRRDSEIEAYTFDLTNSNVSLLQGSVTKYQLANVDPIINPGSVAGISVSLSEDGGIMYTGSDVQTDPATSPEQYLMRFVLESVNNNPPDYIPDGQTPDPLATPTFLDIQTDVDPKRKDGSVTFQADGSFVDHFQSSDGSLVLLLVEGYIAIDSSDQSTASGAAFVVCDISKSTFT